MILGRTRSISFAPSLIISFILFSAILLISFVAALITPGTILASWLTLHLHAYAKPYLFKEPRSCVFCFSLEPEWARWQGVRFLFFLLLLCFALHAWVLNVQVRKEENPQMNVCQFWVLLRMICLVFLPTSVAFRC